MAGKFIVIDGIDGCGKTTICSYLGQHLETMGFNPVMVRDPGGTNIGQQIRTILLNPDNKEMNPATELLLYVASRAQLVGDIIKPALQEGKIVISDRFTTSTFAYQSVTGGWEENELRTVVSFGLQGVRPDALILLDLPVETAMKRISRNKDRMEQKGIEFFKKVQKKFVEMAVKEFKDVMSIVNAENMQCKVQEEVQLIVSQILGSVS